MAKTVVGLIENFNEAQAAVRDLAAAGFSREHIGFVANEKYAGDIRTETKDNSAASGALTGAGTGAALGGIAGLLLSLAPLAIPGIGPIIAAGPIAAALAGAGIGAVAGGLIGGLAKLGIPEEEAHTYAEGVRRGGTLVTATAHMDPMVDRAIDILKRHGAVDIDERATTWRKAGWSGRVGDEEDTIPVLQEEVAISRRRVSKGSAKVYSHVTERQPVHRPATAADQAAFNERVYEIHEPGEEPAIGKRGREVERAGERWDGTERRMASGTPYAGIERRKLT